MEETYQKNNSNLYLINTDKKSKPKVSMREKMIMIKAEIKEIETRK
jgi:hypothetical protein